MNTRKFGMNYGAVLGLILILIALLSWVLGVDEQESDSDETPSQDDIIDLQNEEVDSVENSDKTTTESETGASQYTDEQLLAAGWTQEQIDQMRGN